MADVAVVNSNIGLAVDGTSPDASTNLGIGENKNVEVHSGTGGSGVIGITAGKVVITDSGAALLTLALPTAGSKVSGGNDGDRLTIYCTTAHAHTVTTPTAPVDGLNGTDHIATFASVGDHIELEAYGGVWYVMNNDTTLS
jgi:hypothetical protein